VKSPRRISSSVDVVGVGINATDTIIRLPHFPKLDSKVEILSSGVRAGGQVASAIVACSRWGLKTRYVGKIGKDDQGRFQQNEMKFESVDARWILAPKSSSQTSYILVDNLSGERTVLWKRVPRIALRPSDVKREWISGASLLLVDGHDTAAAKRAAQWAREENVPVVGDFDNRYPGVESLLEFVDFPVTSKDFPERMTGEKNPLKSLPRLLNQFKNRLIVTTLGAHGALAWDGDSFVTSPGFQVDAIDTTGAGDIFHGAFVYGLRRKMRMKEILEFSCAAAALNCTAVGARAGIPRIAQVLKLLKTGRRSDAVYAPDVLLEARKNALARYPAKVPEAAP